MSDYRLLTEQLKTDFHQSLDKLRVYLETKKRFDKKKKLSGWDYAEGLFVTLDFVVSAKKTWDDGIDLINRIQNPEPAAPQNQALIPVIINGQFFYPQLLNWAPMPVLSSTGTTHYGGGHS